MKTEAQNMGEKTSSVFSRHNESQTTREMYTESAAFFSGVIKERISPDVPHSLLDVGSYKGELLQDLKNQLDGYTLETTAVDINESALSENCVADHCVVGVAERLPFNDHIKRCSYR